MNSQGEKQFFLRQVRLLRVNQRKRVRPRAPQVGAVVSSSKGEVAWWHKMVLAGNQGDFGEFIRRK